MMKDPKILLVAVLLVAGATGVQSQFNLDSIKNTVGGWGKDVGDWGKGFGEDVGNWGKDLWNKIGTFKDEAMKKFTNKLPMSMRTWIGKGDYSDANVTEMLDKIPPRAWNVMKLEQLTTLGKTKFDQLLKEGENKLPPRILRQLENIKNSNVTTKEAITALKGQTCRMGEGGQGCKATKPVLNAYIRALGDPEKLKESNITSFGRKMVLNLPPLFLKKITDEGALRKINVFMKSCTSSQGSDCPKAPVAQAIIDDNYMKLYGNIDMWNSTIIDKIGGMQELSARDITQLPPATLKEVKSRITTRTFPTKQSRMVLDALSKAEETNKMTTDELKTWADGLGKLKAFLLQSDIPPAAQSDPTLSALVNTNGLELVKLKQLNPKATKTLVEETLKGEFTNNMTQAFVTEYRDLLDDTSLNVLKKLVKRKLLKGTDLRVLGDNFKVAGPGSYAKCQTLLEALRTESKTNIPPALLKCMSPSQISQMTGSEITKYLNYVTGNKMESVGLDDAQKSAIVFKVSGREELNLPVPLKGMVPFSSYAGHGISQSKDLANGMPQISAAGMKLGSNAFGAMVNITKADIINNKDEVPYMSSADAAKIFPGDIDAINEAISSYDPQKNNMPPSMDVCRILKDKMLMNAKKMRDVSNGVEYAQTMFTGDVEKTPTCVVAALGEKAVMSIPPELKTLLMQMMGLKDNSMGISPKRRRLIAKEAMKLTVGKDTMIGMDILTMLGKADVDLPAEFLKKFDIKAATDFLMRLEDAFRTYKKPCLDRDQKEEIAEMMERVYGPPEQWESLEGRCCLLEVMSNTELNKILPSVLSSCTCDPDLGSFEDYMAAKEVLCKADVGGSEIEKSKKAKENVEMKQIEAALSILDDINASRRRKRAAPATACDTAAIGGAPMLTTSEIKAMSNESVLGCLYELGQMEIEDEDKAKALFNRIMEAKDDRLDTLTLDQMKNMGYIWRGLKKESDVSNLSTFVYGSMDEAVGVLGQDLDLDKDVVKALAKKVLEEWRASKDMSAKDLLLVNQLICGFNETTIGDIPIGAFKEAMKTIKDLDCEDDVKRFLAVRAEAAYGDLKNWDASIVNEIGPIIGSLKPEKLMTIPGKAMAGLSVKGIESISPESIKAMKLEQVKNLPLTVAMSLSSKQKSMFSDDMLAALDKITSSVDSGVAGVMASLVTCLVAAAVAILTVV